MFNRKQEDKKRMSKHQGHFTIGGYYYHTDSNGGHPHYHYFTYNKSDLRRLCNKTTKAKIKQELAKIIFDEEVDENISLPQNKDYKKMTEYKWTIL